MQESIRIPIGLSDDLSLPGVLSLPESSIGIVIFAHGSGSSKASPRNKFISSKLNDNKIATLLFDLLTDGEQSSDKKLEGLITSIPGGTLNKFNIKLLTERLSIATSWVLRRYNNSLPISYFGSSTGGAAALVAGSRYLVSSIVIHSGRTDLVDNEILAEISSPCLFIIGDKEKAAIRIAKHTVKNLRNVRSKKIRMIKNASHLLEETGTVESLAGVTTEWFLRYY
jgi:putative phosphoribosyl transferase